MNITYTEIIILILKSYICKLLNWLILVLLKYISDKYLIFVPNNIKYNAEYDVSDSSSDEIIEPIYVKEYEIIKNTFKIHKIINKYNKNKHNMYNKDTYYILKAFLFNFDGEQVIEKCVCTKKIIIIFNRFGCLNTNNIKNMINNHKYIYIFYKNDMNEFHIKIIDMNNNIDVINNNELMFNLIHI
jgi:hypothetical protein